MRGELSDRHRAALCAKYAESRLQYLLRASTEWRIAATGLRSDRCLRTAPALLHTGVAIRRLSARASYDRFLQDRKSTRLNSSHGYISYAVFCLKKKNKKS